MTDSKESITHRGGAPHQNLKIGLLVTFISIAVLGFILHSLVMDYARSHERRHFMKLAEVAQLSLDPVLVGNLTASPEDLATPSYKAIKKRLIALRDADSSYRFVYLMAKKNDQIFFLEDAEPESSSDFSPPGQLYPDASEKLSQIFVSGEAFVEGPVVDQWGEWVSAHAPIRDQASGEVVAIIGLDIDTREWNASINAYRFFSITIIVLIVAIAAIFSLALFRMSADRDRIASINRELMQIKEELLQNERLATLGQLNAVVSHEIRNPLGTISNALFMAEEAIEDNNHEIYTKSMALCKRSVDRCNRIISELLDFSKTNNLLREKVLVERWLDEVLDQSPFLTKIKVEKDFATGAELEIDLDRMQRAIDNVCLNAAQAMAAVSGIQAILKIQTRRAKDRLEIRFIDNGPGISSEVMQKIFEPMFSTKTFGVGLGLPIVRNIMTDHGGGVEIESTTGKGATVTLWLPLH